MEISNKNIALYIRLSLADKETGNTKNESNSIVGQRMFLNNYLDNHNKLNNYNRIEYVDDGFSGTNDNRPMFQEMIEEVKNGNIKAICVRDCSRFFRDYTEAGNYIECVFPFLGVRFISVNDNYDSNDYKGTTGSFGSFELAIRNIVYASYSRDLSEKTKSAKYHMINNGKYVGANPPYGYMMHPTEKHKIVVDPIASKVVRKIFDYAIDGVKVSEIANKLNEENIDAPAKHFANIYPENRKYLNKNTKWRYNAIHKILTNEYYIGTMICLKRGKENIYAKNIAKEPIKIVKNHEPIVSEKEFQQASFVIKKLSDSAKENRKKVIPNSDNVLKGLVYCGNCMKMMYRAKSHNKFYCAYPKENNCYCHENNTRIHISETELREKVLEKIEKNKDKFKKKNKEVNRKNNNDLFYKTTKNEKNTLNNQLKVLNQNKAKLYEQYVNDEFSKEVYLNKRKIVDESIAKLNKMHKENDSIKNEQNNNLELIENKDTLTYEMAHTYIDKIYVYDKGIVEIILKPY